MATYRPGAEETGVSPEELEQYLIKAKPWITRCYEAAFEFVLWWNKLEQVSDVIRQRDEAFAIFERHGIPVPDQRKIEFLQHATAYVVADRSITSCLVFSIAHDLHHCSVTDEMVFATDP